MPVFGKVLEKVAWVGSNFRSGFDPIHPYLFGCKNAELCFLVALNKWMIDGGLNIAAMTIGNIVGLLLM